MQVSNPLSWSITHALLGSRSLQPFASPSLVTPTLCLHCIATFYCTGIRQILLLYSRLGAAEMPLRPCAIAEVKQGILLCPSPSELSFIHGWFEQGTHMGWAVACKIKKGWACCSHIWPLVISLPRTNSITFHFSGAFGAALAAW